MLPWYIVCYPRCILLRVWVSKQCEMISWWDDVNDECFRGALCVTLDAFLMRAWVSKQCEMISWWDNVNASVVHCVLPSMHFVACLGVKAMRDDQLVGRCECFRGTLCVTLDAFCCVSGCQSNAR